jgi:hypothetical protein
MLGSVQRDTTRPRTCPNWVNSARGDHDGDDAPSDDFLIRIYMKLLIEKKLFYSNFVKNI